MAKAIDHNFGSTVATVGKETVKSTFMSVVYSGLVGAVITGLVAVAGIAVLGGAFGFFAPAMIGLAAPSFLAGAGTVLLSTPALLSAAAVSTVGGLAGAVAGTAMGIPIVGAVIGLFRGSNKVASEKTEFELRMANHEQLSNIKAQQAYIAGAQAGQQALIQEIQAQQQAAEAAGAHSQRILQERQVAAAASKNPTVGA